MKRIILITITLITLVLATNPVVAQERHQQENQEEIMNMMEDSDMRAMMMERIAEDPKMQQEMMTHMRKAMTGNKHMMGNMQQMNQSNMMGQMRQRMNDPEMRERMQQHMQFMQSMLEGEEMDRSRMMEMMQNSEMMKMNMMCMQMMTGSDMDDGDTESGDQEQQQ